MRYPKRLNKNGTIGVVAPSTGFTEHKYITMCNNAKERLEKLGYSIIYSESCFNDLNGRSNTSLIRAKEFEDMYLNNEIDILIAIGGGEYEMEILDSLDLDKIKNSPVKLFCGCSDNTILTFLLTTYCDIASVYGHNFYEIGIEHKVINDYVEFLKGNNLDLVEIKKVEEKDESWKFSLPQINYDCNYINDWKLYYEKDKIEVSGMVIGGLLDNLICICGTKYDNLSNFTQKYKNYGFIWYIDICTLNPEEVKRGLWQLKNAGWFDYAKLIIIGRPINQSDSYGINYRENMYDELKELKIPIIFDANIGHIAPCYYMYNGAIARVIYENNLGKIQYI
ncbi:MAG: LD-carboxypeptidase [Bacilli bacterium]|nr:LD-carboxypeptidase [Bacilli bacterium]